MSIVQTEYPNFHDALVAGQVADTVTCDIDSRIVNTATPVPFGRGVRPDGTGTQGIALGVRQQQVALVNGGINNSVTTVNVDGYSAVWSEFPAGRHILVDSEFMYVSGVAANALTIVRGALGSTAASHADDAAVFVLDGPIDFDGIAIMDERKPAASGTSYAEGESCSVLWRGDVAVEVSGAVSRDSHVVCTRDAGTDDPVGSFSARAPDATHVRIPGASFRRAAAAGEISVIRLSGAHRSLFVPV